VHSFLWLLCDLIALRVLCDVVHGGLIALRRTIAIERVYHASNTGQTRTEIQRLLSIPKPARTRGPIGLALVLVPAVLVGPRNRFDNCDTGMSDQDRPWKRYSRCEAEWRFLVVSVACRRPPGPTGANALPPGRAQPCHTLDSRRGGQLPTKRKLNIARQHRKCVGPIPCHSFLRSAATRHTHHPLPNEL